MAAEIRIKIGGVPHAPTWDAVERLVASALGKNGGLVRISRPDGGHGYREYGQYEADFMDHDGEIHTVSVEVVP